MGNQSVVGDDDVQDDMNAIYDSEDEIIEHLSESLNIFFTLSCYKEHFPNDCTRIILSYLPKCWHCYKTTIQYPKIHNYCEASRTFRCVFCHKKIARGRLLIHEKICQGRCKDIWENKMMKLEPQFRAGFTSFTSVAMTCFLVEKFKNFKLIVLEIGDPRPINKEEEMKFPTLKMKKGWPNEKSRYEHIPKPYSVKLCVRNGILYTVISSSNEVKKKEYPFLFRIDQLSKIFRLLTKNFDFSYLPVPTSDKFSHPDRFKNVKNVKQLQLKTLTTEGFLRIFFELHGLFHNQTKNPKFDGKWNRIMEFTDAEYLVKSFLPEVTDPNLPFHKSQVLPTEAEYNHNLMTVRIYPYPMTYGGIRPRNSFFSRLGSQESVRVHLSLVLVSSCLIFAPFSNCTLDKNLEVPKKEIFVKPMIYFDGCYFEWNEHELIVPMKSFDMFTPCSDQHLEIGVKETEPMCAHLRAAEIITTYNSKYRFKDELPDRKNKNERNRMDFVEDFLVEVSVGKNLENGLFGLACGLGGQKLFQNFRLFGKSRLILSIRNTKKKNLLEKEEIEFKTHEQLDDFVNESNHSVFDDEAVPELRILKAFDRVFWMFYLKFKDRDPEVKKICEPSKNPKLDRNGYISQFGYSCPFKPPYSTYGYFAGDRYD